MLSLDLESSLERLKRLQLLAKYGGRIDLYKRRAYNTNESRGVFECREDVTNGGVVLYDELCVGLRVADN